MKRWFTVQEVRKMPAGPKRQTLYDKLKTVPRPAFCRKKLGVVQINTTHPDYLAWVESLNKKRNPSGLKANGKPYKNGGELSPDEDEFFSLKLQLEREKVRASRIKNAELEIKLKRANHSIIDWALAEYLFFGYFEKINIQLVKLDKKLSTVIDNLVAEKDPEGIKKRLRREFTALIREAKKAQAQDVKRWREENDADL